MTKEKIFCIGLSKTGTSTLGRCMQHFGFSHKTYDLYLLRCAKKGMYEEIYNVVDNYDSFEDWPWPLLYKEFDKRYPDSKFILTIRKDSESWYESRNKHMKRNPETIPGFKEARRIYDNPDPVIHKQETIARYENHSQEIIDYAAPLI